MRIVAGTHRSRKLETPQGNAIRPTSDKIRQAVFNMLNARGYVVDANVMDVFCGTGALGLEALSQGAAHCIFFDKDKKAVKLCQKNIEILKEEARTEVFIQDAMKVKARLENNVKADLVFLDPPYMKNLIVPVIEALQGAGWLAPDAVFVMEMARNENIASTLIEILSEKTYGETKIIIGCLAS